MDGTLAFSDVKSHDSFLLTRQFVCRKQTHRQELKRRLHPANEEPPPARQSEKVGAKPGRRARVHCFRVQEPLTSHHASLVLSEESETGRFFGRGAGELLRPKQKGTTQSAVPPPRERLVSRLPVHACTHIRTPIPSRIFLYAGI